MGTAPPLTRVDIAMQIALLRQQLGLEVDTAELARAAEHVVRPRQPEPPRATLTPDLGASRH